MSAILISEKIMLYTLYILYYFEFRKGYYNKKAILEITDNLKIAIYNKQITCGLFVDLSNAFETINGLIWMITWS